MPRSSSVAGVRHTNVVTSSIAFEGNGVVQEYVGGYQDWVNQGGRLVSFMDQEKESKAQAASAAKAAAELVAKAPEKAPAPKLSFKQQKELEQITKDIEKMEAKIAALTETIADPGFYAQAQPAIDAKLKELSTVQAQLDERYAQWETLA